MVGVGAAVAHRFEDQGTGLRSLPCRGADGVHPIGRRRAAVPPARARPSASRDGSAAVVCWPGTPTVRVPAAGDRDPGTARHVDRYGEVSPWRTTNAAWRSSGRSSRTTSRPTTRWAARPWPTGTTWASPRPPSATTWRCSRSRATSPSRTPAPAGCPPTRATGSSSTGCRRSSRCRPPSARRSSGSSTAPSTCTTCWAARVRLLAQLTRQVAVVQYPTLSRSAVRHLEVVQLSASRLHAGAHHRHRPGRAARRRLPGRHRRRRRRRAAHAAQLRVHRREARRGRRQGARPAGDGAAAPARPGRHGQRHAAGDPRRAQRGPAGHRRDGEPRPRQRAGLPGHRAAAAGGAGRAGRRPAVDERGGRRAPCWCASARRTPTRRSPAPRWSPSGTAPPDRALGGLGVVGPTRMDYPTNMAAVRAVARYVGHLLAES